MTTPTPKPPHGGTGVAHPASRAAKTGTSEPMASADDTPASPTAEPASTDVKGSAVPAPSESNKTYVGSGTLDPPHVITVDDLQGLVPDKHAKAIAYVANWLAKLNYESYLDVKREMDLLIEQIGGRQSVLDGIARNVQKQGQDLNTQFTGLHQSLTDLVKAISDDRQASYQHLQGLFDGLHDRLNQVAASVAAIGAPAAASAAQPDPAVQSAGLKPQEVQNLEQALLVATDPDVPKKGAVGQSRWVASVEQHLVGNGMTPDDAKLAVRRACGWDENEDDDPNEVERNVTILTFSLVENAIRRKIYDQNAQNEIFNRVLLLPGIEKFADDKERFLAAFRNGKYRAEGK